MTIQFNTDNHVKGGEAISAPLNELIADELSHYSDHITRLEVHLSDENGDKGGGNDKRCLLEARVEGRKPIAVKHFADSHEQAVTGALSKLKASLHTIFGKQRDHHTN